MENESPPSMSLPPEDISIEGHVRREWDRILKAWRSGWAADSDLMALEDYIEFHRSRIFEKDIAGSEYDWSLDWRRANYVHNANIDFVKNRKVLNEDIRKMWFEWSERQYTFYAQLSLEALRSMILVNGAAILAALAVLSGQISSPSAAALLTARVTVFTSVVSIILMALGHSILFLRVNEVTSTVRGVLSGTMKHKRLYAISRYLRRYLDPIANIANYLIFSSIGVFAFSALICSIILLSS